MLMPSDDGVGASEFAERSLWDLKPAFTYESERAEFERAVAAEKARFREESFF